MNYPDPGGDPSTSESQDPESFIPQTIRGSIYDWPHYYELVYGSDWAAETRFLTGCLERFVEPSGTSAGGPSLFEPACGTGRLLFRLARKGYRVSGLDINQATVDYCNRRLARNGIPDRVISGDMCDFRLESRCDVAFNTINSFRHLLSDDLAEAHLRCMATAIRPGGIYVLGFHLTPTEIVPMESEAWSARRGHLQINTSMWLVWRDLKQRFERHALAFDVYTPTRQFRILDEIDFRTYTVQQFVSLMQKVPEFEIAVVFDFAYDLESPQELDDRTEDAVFILKRRFR